MVSLRRLGGGMAALALIATAPAMAERGMARVQYPAQYVQECGSCHVPYPQGLLPRESWQRIMTGLVHHFGADASLEPAQARAIADWLQANAGRSRRNEGQPPEDRITRSAWFVREHREVRPDSWKRAAVRSASNCSACHPRAAEGAFDEHDIRIPR